MTRALDAMKFGLRHKGEKSGALLEGQRRILPSPKEQSRKPRTAEVREGPSQWPGGDAPNGRENGALDATIPKLRQVARNEIRMRGFVVKIAALASG